MKSVLTIVIMVTGLFVWTQVQAEESGLSRDQQNKIEMIRIMLQAERKMIVAKNMQLCGEEKRTFWPLYNEYQFSISRVKDRLTALISEYARYYRGDHFPEKRALTMIDEFLTFQSKLVKVKHSYLKRFKKVLPPKKVVRFYQIEHRLDARDYVLMAKEIPLAE